MSSQREPVAHQRAPRRSLAVNHQYPLLAISLQRFAHEHVVFEHLDRHYLSTEGRGPTLVVKQRLGYLD